jgi:hypothetical protein
VASTRLVTVMLARAWDPAGLAQDAGRIEFDIALDPHGHPDPQARLADAASWPARHLRPDAPPETGDVVLDEDGWQLRFSGGAGHEREGPVHRLGNLAGGLRPGEVLTLRAPGGEEVAWRVVEVRAAR